MTPTRNFKDLDAVAKGMGLSGENGVYTTPLGLKVDCTACDETRQAIGYRIAVTLGHITKW